MDRSVGFYPTWRQLGEVTQRVQSGQRSNLANLPKQIFAVVKSDTLYQKILPDLFDRLHSSC